MSDTLTEDPRFVTTLVSIKDSEPPEELLASFAGGCGRWQISMGVIAVLCGCIHGINLHLPVAIAPRHLNFTCAEGDSSQCVTTNGTKCQNFTYYTPYKMLTYTEKFSLVCDREHFTFWVDIVFRVGMSCSYILVGVVADRFGKKVTTMIFIPCFGFAGIALSLSTSFGKLCVFIFFYALFSAVLNVVPEVIVCNNTGNKWRTFALGVVTYPLIFGWYLTVQLPYVFHSAQGLVVTVAFLPLFLLILLLYFKDDPIFILIRNDFVKAEDSFRKIAAFNRRPLPYDAKLIPVKTINPVEEGVKPSLSICLYLRTKKTRDSFLALTWLWFFNGFCFAIFTVVTSEITDNLFENIIVQTCCFLVAFLSVTMCEWVENRKVLWCLLIAKNLCMTITLLTMRFFIKDQNSTVLFVLNSLSYFFAWGSFIVLRTITPRMFPTGRRGFGQGFCLCVMNFGRMGLLFLGLLLSRDDIIWILLPFLVFVGCVSESLSCCKLWNVRNRELPDFVEDCIRFDSYFKPRRYYHISARRVTHSEIETTAMSM